MHFLFDAASVLVLFLLLIEKMQNRKDEVSSRILPIKGKLSKFDYLSLRWKTRRMSSKSELSANQVYRLVKIYESGAEDQLSIMGTLYRKSEQSKVHFLESMSYQYLLNRIGFEPLHVLMTVSQNPWMADASCAALNRSLFECAVNFLYIISAGDATRAKHFFVDAFRMEVVMDEAISKWVGYEDKFIHDNANNMTKVNFRPSRADLEKEKLKLGLPVGIGRYPSVEQRCKDISPRWHFFYDSMYRGLSSWQHGDPSRYIFEPKSSESLNEPSRPVFEGLVQLAWMYQILYETNRELAVILKCDQNIRDSIDGTYAPVKVEARALLEKAVAFYHGV